MSFSARSSFIELPLVAAQPGIWMADQLSPHANAFAVAHLVELRGPVQAGPLVEAIVQGLGELDSLRLNFAEREGALVQWIDGDATIPAPEWLDLRGTADPEGAARAAIRADLAGDLRATSGGPLSLNRIYQLGDDHLFWYQRYHHLLIDGYGFAALAKRVAALYSAKVRGETVEASPFVSFAEVVREYQDYQQSAVRERDEAFWGERGAALPPAASLAPGGLAGQVPTPRVVEARTRVSAEVFSLLAEQGKAQGVTPADLAVALAATWFARLSGQPSFSAGFIFMRRMGSVALKSGGATLNVLPLGINADSARTLPQLAAALAAELKKIRRHQRYDAEQIARDLGRPGDAEPLTGPVINLKLFDFALDFAGVPGITHELASGPVRDLEIALYLEASGALDIKLLGNAERYAANLLQGQVERFGLLAQQFADQPGLTLGEVEVLGPTDRAWLAGINATERVLPATTLTRLLAEQASRTPEAPALADEQLAFNYRETRQQVRALAQRLSAAGVGRGDIVAVALPRSVFLSLALLATVELGAAYLPLDSGYPDERLQLMLDDARPRVLVTDPSQRGRFPGLSDDQVLILNAPLKELDHAPAFDGPRPSDPAYVLYTSGSTGRPKGVVVGHAAIVNRLLWMQDSYPIGAGDTVLQKTPSSFDVSVWEFFWPLLVGARLYLAPPEAHRDPEALQQLFARERVTTVHFVPSMLAAFVASLDGSAAVTRCASLRQVFCSGEALPTELARTWERRVGAPLHNLYGPTEAAVDVSYHPAHGAALAAVTGSSVPIGKPVWNTGLHILDERLRPVPPGVAGELYLSGVQLADGYLGRPELTAARFIAAPNGQGERLYRTGDVARWLPEGVVEYLGRSDDQVKIRGQRIELAEIDHALLALPGVAQAVTHARVLGEATNSTGGDARQLVGYVIAQPGAALDLERLRARLGESLPPHLVPVALVELPALPLGATGKLDRKALPAPQGVARAASRAPAPGLESDLAAAFSEVLGCAIVGADDDFFALGGHSLLAMTLAANLRRRLGRPVSIGQIMVASSVARLARELERDVSDRRAGFETLLPLRPGDGPTLFCFHPASGFAWQFSVLQRHLDPRWSLLGIQSPRPDGPLAQGADLEDVIQRHLRTLREVQPHGPYHLLGYSLGGTLAQGLAARLQAAGEEVAFLGLLDTYPPETQNWQEREGQRELDPEVLAEVNREREAFLAAQQGLADPALGEGAELFATIEGNYADSVRLLATAHSARFDGEALMFVARRTLPAGMDVKATWAPWITRLQAHEVDCAHVDIIAPAQLAQIGPVLNRALKAL
ncbi:enterobactin synthase subunit F [Pseudomonas sp. EpS/L25]|uniref:enterobactin synthase subunit F n=1 Tax=Pseudomonas sp. EpS/L25 TaxID=1749078 RepID=UPI0007440200|nr:enterobactin synthase subunit F [Pseudomonas sp. EpS/L25]KUM43426.1 non-ribosomal peptide synthetase [Pseudomonas sp. EpS/L25]